ncbi:MAG TPA: hypothetical protein ENG74_03595 [Thermoplasmatales archaeon]|nr:hypothetical protein [Thermoplasmatales archaeon]
MKRIIVFSVLALSVLCLSFKTAGASKAGVGVVNVTPTYKHIRLINGEHAVELCLSISDYNSWKDVWKVEVIAESGDETCAHFIFLHYRDAESFDEVNLFEEDVGEYLLPELCTVKRSLTETTIDDRCVINVSFIFKPIPGCDRLTIYAYDREGEKASIEMFYGSYHDMRNKEAIVPFWTGQPMRISPDLPDVVAGSISITSVAFVMLRRRR